MNVIRSIIFIRHTGSGKNRAVSALVGSLLWSVLPAIGLQSSISQFSIEPLAASAQESTDASAVDEAWEHSWDADPTAEPAFLEQDEAVNETETTNPEETDPSSSTSVQVPQEFIATWIDDLKQSTDRWIQVDLSDQQLIAWEGDRQVYAATVSTGRAEEPTLTGVFAIQIKQEKSWMQGDTYEIPNVPYTMYYSGNYAIHGTYWHNSFGTPVSNGCINLPVDQAAWLYDWASIGTTVVIEP